MDNLTTQDTLTSGHQLVVPFEDNRLAAELFGEYDANLAMLEDRLGIEVVARGNVVTLRGAKSSCALAKEVLEGLYGRLEAGEAIDAGDIDGFIRHASAAPYEADDADKPQQSKIEQIRTRKRLITARSPAQSAYLAAMSSKDLVFATGPAGTGKTYLGLFSLDDAVCAGALVQRIRAAAEVDAELNDAAMGAVEMALTFRINYDFLASTSTGQHLIEIGLGEDLKICAEIDRHSVVPEMDDRVIQLRSGPAGSTGPGS